LLERLDGSGRVPAVEVLLNNGRVTERILDPESTGELAEVIADSSFDGMQSFDQHLLSLVRESLVSEEDARAVATNPHDFGLALAAAMAEPRADVGSAYASEGV
jgi:twitching motility protein PilT